MGLLGLADMRTFATKFDLEIISVCAHQIYTERPFFSLES